MAGYGYQYDTNPRKIKPEYVKKKKVPKTTRIQTNTNKSMTKRKNVAKKNIQEEKNAKRKLVSKTKFSIFVKCVVLFAVVFLILFRNAQINESFSKIQSLKSEISAIQKENDQTEINIQNSMNTNNLEQNAKVLLGMQKLTNKQIVYINIPKKDYVEYNVQEIKIEDEKNIIERLIDKIKDIF